MTHITLTILLGSMISSFSWAELPPNLQALVVEVNRREPQCHSYEEDLKKTAILHESGERFQEASTAEKVIKKLQFTGSWDKGRQISAYLVKKAPTIGEADLKLAFWDANICIPTMANYIAIKGLLGSAHHFNLGASRKREAARTALNYVRQASAQHGTLIEQFIGIDLLKRLSDGGFVTISTADKNTLLELQGWAKQKKKSLQGHVWPNNKKDFDNLSKEKRNQLVDVFRKEITLSEQIRKRVHELSQRAKIS